MLKIMKSGTYISENGHMEKYGTQVPRIINIETPSGTGREKYGSNCLLKGIQ